MKMHRLLAHVRAGLNMSGAGVIGAAAALAITGGCAGAGSGSTSALRIDSRDQDTWMAPAYQTAVYRAIDENTADIFLSDVAETEIVDRMRQGAEGPPATITHVRLFLAPKAGKTPIDFTASNTTITHVVLSGQSMGVYGGGGFLLPEDTVGAELFSGRIRDASLRMLRCDDGFADMLGLAEMSGRVSARRDDTLADTISSRLVLMLRH